MNTHTCTFNDVTYVSQPDPENELCHQCAGETMHGLCSAQGGKVKPACYDENIIWVKAEPTTVVTEGRKFDNDKPQFALVPPQALIETVKVLTYGAQKYAPGNWRKVPDAKNRYFGAAMRHMWSWLKGEKVDSETGISHLAHALCSIFFILELELEEA